MANYEWRGPSQLGFGFAVIRFVTQTDGSVLDPMTAVTTGPSRKYSLQATAVPEADVEAFITYLLADDEISLTPAPTVGDNVLITSDSTAVDATLQAGDIDLDVGILLYDGTDVTGYVEQYGAKIRQGERAYDVTLSLICPWTGQFPQ